jgi:serine/threonine protein kinase
VPPSPAELARRFPSLGVLELLGQGGMGAVYKARQTKLDRLVAVKVLPPEVARDPAFAQRFMREARSLARLNHPHIVTVHDFGDVDGLYYFTMEYVDGQNLRDHMQAGPLSAEAALATVTQLCDALQYAHDEGMVHRDIKPENILIDRKGRVKVADFGLAKLVGLTPAYLTLTGAHEMMGTLLYMAPEQMTRAHSVDHRADLYSLGVILYEMLTGELPLGRFAPPSRKAAVSERFDQIVLRALAREPAERYQDAAAFKQDVEAALDAPAAGGRRLSALGRRVWPSARFGISSPDGGSVLANGMVCRDDDALILEVEFAKKKFQSFFKESGKPQEVRIPLDEVTALAYGCGWGKPPHSVIVKVSRLSALGGIPGSRQGRVELVIPAEDRDEARSLVESIRGPLPLDRERAKREIALPALGLLASGTAGLLIWAGIGMLHLGEEGSDFNDLIPLLVTVGPAIAALAGAQVVGAALMLRLRAYPCAATAAIVAMIPWSPAWVLGLTSGIWACNVLGRPVVTGEFFCEKRQAGAGPAGARRRGARVASRFLSLARSFGRYVFTTMPGWKRAADDPEDATPPAIEGPVPGRGVNSPGESREIG